MKMLAVKFNAVETGRAFVFPKRWCVTQHTQSFDDVTVAAESTVTPRIGNSLNYTSRAFVM